nr:fimbrial protein [uncultured Enterobacter sp.]
MKMRYASVRVAAFFGWTLYAASAIAITGTPHVQATFTSTIEAGTCTAQIQDASGRTITSLGFGDVYKSDLTTQTRSLPFALVLVNCAGVRTASVQATNGAGGRCSGAASQGDSFGAGNATAFEIWKGVVDTGTLLSCNTAPVQTLSVDGNTARMEMAARVVIASGKTINDVTTGDVSAPVTFLVTYQ